jgi:hypothetical protein
MTKLSALNFDIAANTTIALSMMRYVCDSKLTQSLIDSPTTNKYILSATSSLNQTFTLKRFSKKDIENHIRTIQCLLTLELKPTQIEVLESVVVEYLIS